MAGICAVVVENHIQINTSGSLVLEATDHGIYKHTICKKVRLILVCFFLGTGAD
jgi:hypothetical protein